MLIYAHRGARGCAPENTKAAFVKALQLHADGIELDIHLTKDGEIVICHDHDISRTSNHSGLIKDLTLAELKSCDFGSWFSDEFQGERIMTLEEFLAWYISTPLLLNIEIKNGPVIYHTIEEKTLLLLKKYEIEDRVILSSFYHPSLVKIKALNDRIQTGALFACRPVDPLQIARTTQANFLHPHWHSLDDKWVQKAREQCIGINVFTINEPEEYKLMADYKVNAIFSDYPERFVPSQSI